VWLEPARHEAAQVEKWQQLCALALLVKGGKRQHTKRIHTTTTTIHSHQPHPHDGAVSDEGSLASSQATGFAPGHSLALGHWPQAQTGHRLAPGYARYAHIRTHMHTQTWHDWLGCRLVCANRTCKAFTAPPAT